MAPLHPFHFVKMLNRSVWRGRPGRADEHDRMNRRLGIAKFLSKEGMLCIYFNSCSSLEEPDTITAHCTYTHFPYIYTHTSEPGPGGRARALLRLLNAGSQDVMRCNLFLFGLAVWIKSNSFW